jgi:triosephosphate isomerase
MRRTIIAGNWKMNKTGPEAVQLAKELLSRVSDVRDMDVVVCPPFTALESVAWVLGEGPVKIGAQNMHWAEGGAYTGEVAARMLLTIGCRYVILGHSERRAYFGEGNSDVNKKLRAALATSLIPIVCVGEKLEEREGGQTEAVVQDHVLGAFEDFSAVELQRAVVAYEPVWAIGTGRTASPEQANDVHAFIRSLLQNKFGESLAQGIRIQYGGSVKPENAASLLNQPEIDGALVGGASLDADSFTAIIQAVR